jgi:hypothetical protein
MFKPHVKGQLMAEPTNWEIITMSGMTGSEEKILSRVRMTTDGVWIGDSIY